MPSTTRGSILISTANDIGEALVEKLGGVGYSPNEWKEKYNLCGIAPVDSAPALSVLADSAGTGDERGSILIATADAIGAILNKKYNVLRGFKPKEWASACRKMKALEEGSVASSSIASFSDGADTVPLTSCVCNIDANLDGKSAVNAVHAGVNLLSMVNYDGGVYNPDVDRVLNLTISETQFTKNGNVYSVTTSATWKTFTVLFPIVAGVTYYEKWTLSIESGQQGSTRAYLDKDFKVLAKYNNNSSDPIITNGVMTPPTGAKYLAITWTNRSTAVQTLNITEPMIELGSSASAFEPYKGETKTADLGRTIYGGTADIIKGEGKETCSFPTLLSSLAWSKTTISGHDAFYANLPDGYMGQGSDGLDGDCDTYAITTDANLGTDKTIRFYYNANFNISRCVIRDDQYASLTGAQFKETVSGNIVYELAESAQTDFTFEPVKIDSFPGVNNIWNDCGDTAVEYYQAPTPYARKTATGGIANFSDQRTDLPLTKAIANIAPSIAGKSAVNLYQGKKNLLNANDSSYTFQVGDNYRYNCGTVSLKKGVTYTFSALQEDALTSNTRNTLAIGVNEVYTYESATGTNYHNQSGVHSMQYTPAEDCEAAFLVWVHTPSNAVKYSSFMLEVGSSASAYVPYQAPTTYTAELGETVYGGSVDFVSGEVQKICGKKTFNGSENWSAYTTGNGYAIPLTGMERGTWYTSPLALSYPLPKVPNNDSLGVRIGVNNDGIYVAQANTIEGVTDITSFKAYLSENPLTIIYPLAAPTESTIPGRVISPIEGVNNYWNDAGGDTEIQYFENEA